MPQRIRMKFWRDDYSNCGCLEYSYVPQGFRRVIRLVGSQQDGTCTDVLPDGTNPSLVQVYTLNNNNRAGTAMWMFPAAPYNGVIESVSVEVLQATMVAIGKVYYADGHIETDIHQLNNHPPHCPEVQPNCD
ncbi:MAG: hypothetical protein IT367_07755 [Candidatus Hydrogenedentes bacterium]|nr:hypothetical protein [Candidatus Hydrogenedentota bacterium]